VSRWQRLAFLSKQFDPRTIAGIYAWWDASDSATITTDTGVSVWADKSGNGRNATQSTGNNQPTRTVTINGRLALTFDGTNDSLSFTGASRTDETMLVVARQRDSAADTANTNRYGTLLGSSSSSRGHTFRSQYASAPSNFLFDSVFSGFTSGTNRVVRTVTGVRSGDTAGDIPLNVYTISRSTSAGISQFINNQAGGTATTSEALTLDRIGVGGTTNYWIGEVCEVLLYSRAITAAERTRATDYLMERWGISAFTYTFA
jgi:hypothetical protein